MTTAPHRTALVALVIPNSRWQGKKGWMILPHAALILTALLKGEFDFRILDANAADLSEDDVRAWLREHQPRAVLVSALAVEYHRQYHAVPALARESLPGRRHGPRRRLPDRPRRGGRSRPERRLDLHRPRGGAGRRLPAARSGRRDRARLRRLPGVGYRDECGEPVINPVAGATSIDLKKLVRPDYSLIDVEAYVDQTLEGLPVQLARALGADHLLLRLPVQLPLLRHAHDQRPRRGLPPRRGGPRGDRLPAHPLRRRAPGLHRRLPARQPPAHRGAARRR